MLLPNTIEAYGLFINKVSWIKTVGLEIETELCETINRGSERGLVAALTISQHCTLNTATEVRLRLHRRMEYITLKKHLNYLWEFRCNKALLNVALHLISHTSALNEATQNQTVHNLCRVGTYLCSSILYGIQIQVFLPDVHLSFDLLNWTDGFAPTPTYLGFGAGSK